MQSMLTTQRPTALRAPSCTPSIIRTTRSIRSIVRAQQEPTERPSNVDHQINHHAVLAAAMMAPALLTADPALAINREYGILEGTILSMTHPVVMGALFGITVYAGYLGLKWREVRTIPETIKELKLQLPAANDEGVRPPSDVENKIAELEATRKELIKGKFSDRHEALGALLLGGGVMFSVAGAFNTFIRTGKLFPGPHLWAGAIITVGWALAASLTPAMKKGNETARSLHIAINTVIVGLFLWQIPTGLEIVEKVLQFTTLP